MRAVATRHWVLCHRDKVAAFAIVALVAGTFLQVQEAWGEPEPEPAAEAPPVPVAQSAKGTLIVTATGAEPATLSIDGRDVGTLPWTGEIEAGTHDLVAHSTHGISATRKIAVSANSRTELELKVVENPAKLRVSAGLAGATIRVDGVPHASGRFEGDVPAGKHTISVEHEGYVPSIIHVTLEPDEQKIVNNVVLEKAPPTPTRTPVGNRGIYTMVGVVGLLGKSTNSINESCPASPLGASCSSWINLGSELDVHVGYSFGEFGVEGFILGGTNLTNASQEYTKDVTDAQSPYVGIARKERYLIFEPIFGGGAAGRVSTQGKSYRLSTALGLGVAYRSVIVNRKVDANEGYTPNGNITRRDSASLTPSGAGRAVPLIIWDSDVQLGDTPGTRISLGIRGQVELGSEPTIDLGSGSLGFDNTTGEHMPLGGGALTVRRSPAFFVGPRLAVITGF